MYLWNLIHVIRLILYMYIHGMYRANRTAAVSTLCRSHMSKCRLKMTNSLWLHVKDGQIVFMAQNQLISIVCLFFTGSWQLVSIGGCLKYVMLASVSHVMSLCMHTSDTVLPHNQSSYQPQNYQARVVHGEKIGVIPFSPPDNGPTHPRITFYCSHLEVLPSFFTEPS